MTKRGYIGSRLRVGRLGLTQAPVGGFPDCPKGFPILSTDPPPDSEVLGFTDYRLRSQGLALFEVLSETGGLVILVRVQDETNYPRPCGNAA